MGTRAIAKTGPGGKGLAYLFDGVNDVITVADDDSLSFGDGSNDSPFSILVDGNLTDLTGVCLVSKGAKAAAEYSFRISGPGKLTFQLYDHVDSSYIGRSYNTALSALGIHTSFCSVYDGSKAVTGIDLYINGDQVDDSNLLTGDYTAMHNEAQPISIGRLLVDDATFLSGSLSRILLFNLNLTGAEIIALSSDGAVPDKYLGASQTDLNTSDFVNAGAFFPDFVNNVDGFTSSGSETGDFCYKNKTFNAGKIYRIILTVTDGESSNLLLEFRTATGGGGTATGTILSTSKGYISGYRVKLDELGTYDIVISDLGEAASFQFYALGNVGAIDINSMTITQIGCVLQLEDDSIGITTWTDISGNGLDGTVSGATLVLNTG